MVRVGRRADHDPCVPYSFTCRVYARKTQLATSNLFAPAGATRDSVPALVLSRPTVISLTPNFVQMRAYIFVESALSKVRTRALQPTRYVLGRMAEGALLVVRPCLLPTHGLTSVMYGSYGVCRLHPHPHIFLTPPPTTPQQRLTPSRPRAAPSSTHRGPQPSRGDGTATPASTT